MRRSCLWSGEALCGRREKKLVVRALLWGRLSPKGRGSTVHVLLFQLKKQLQLFTDLVICELLEQKDLFIYLFMFAFRELEEGE